jgi:fatty-acyl-CoA synthase
MMRATAEELIEWRQARLGRNRRPRHVVLAEVPKTSTGKAPKFALRERAKLIEAERA